MQVAAWAVCVLVGLAAIEVLLTTTLAHFGDTGNNRWPTIAAVSLVGWSTALAGLGAWTRRPDRPVGLLLIAAGCAWFIGAASWALDGGAFQGYYVLFMTVLVLAYPVGRLASWPSRLVVGSLALSLGIATAARLLLADGPYFGNCDLPDPICAPLALSFAAAGDPLLDQLDLYNVLDLAFQLAVLLAVGLATLIVGWRWWRAPGPGRRVLAPPAAMAIVLTGALGLAVLRRQQGFDVDPSEVLRGVMLVGLAALPHAFTWDLVRGRLARTAVADLAVVLAGTDALGGVERALATALRDRSLEVLVWSADHDAYLDSARNPTPLPASGDARACTLLEQHGRKVGALLHDPALCDDGQLLDSVAAVAAIAIDNESLATEVRSQLEEVRASRTRIVEAGQAERRRVERDLHDGAQQRLVALGFRLQAAREASADAASLLDEASVELASALDELRRLARGIYPAILAEAGLGAAVEALAERSPIPVGVDVFEGRLSPAMEAAAYFVASEALTNVARHAKASQATVTATIDATRFVLAIADDGVGGADIAAGSGLRGLADRVAALDGRLTLTSPRGGGTLLRAEFPVS